MGNIITVSDWKGVFTNGDRAQMPPDFCVELKNLRPINGKLQKTFGIGNKINTAIADQVNNIYTYIHDELSGDKLYIGVFINSAADNIVTFYAWNGSAWVPINSISGISQTTSHYHKEDKNPIVFADGILRILPGNLGESPGGEECAGLWLGYIDRVFFDGLYSPTAQFYGLESPLPAPAFSFFSTDTILANSDQIIVPGNTGTLYYRFSYIYDGVQESLMQSDPTSIRFPDGETNSIVQFVLNITKATHNLRITAINIYRSIAATGVYSLINTIDLLRPVNTVIENAVDGGYRGQFTTYLSNFTHTINLGFTYQISVGGGPDIGATPTEVPAGSGEYIFVMASSANNSWNGSWTLDENDGGGMVEVESSGIGAFNGTDVLIVDLTLGETSYAGGVIYFDDKIRRIKDSLKRAVQYEGAEIVTGADVDWRALAPSDGIFRVVDSGGNVQYQFYDTGQQDIIQHPLESVTTNPTTGDVTSRFVKFIKVNGKFAQIINNRNIQFNLILDPGGTNEAHNDWVSFSEFGQYDVTPVSNILDFPDTFGGEITGGAELFGNPVILKEHNIFFLNSKTNSTDPALWNVIESVHNVGNLADDGYIEAAGSLFVCYVDGIYRFRPNNLAATDSTPTERLRVSEPIGDIYNDLSLSQKNAIKSEYNPETSEIKFTLGDEIWAFDIIDETWREDLSGVTPAIMATDENGQAIVFQNSDKKLYSFGEDESVAVTLVTKTFELSTVRDQVVRSVAVTYKSSADLPMEVFYDDEIPSGNIEGGVTYTVEETPYINGSTYTVVYNGVSYTHEQTFAGLVGLRTYSVSAGVGVVQLVSSHTLPANTAVTTKKLRIAEWCKRLRVKITDPPGTADMQIDSIVIIIH